MKLLSFLLASLLIFSGQSFAVDIEAREYVLIDFQTGEVLKDVNGDQPMPPSSMSKLMTTYMVFDALRAGVISLDDEFSVSENAWRKGGASSGGSTMFLEVNSRVSVENLIRGIIIQSGNDASIVVAENLAGSEEAFAEEMNLKAEELGLIGSNFRNATGLPDPDHYMTAHDLARLARAIIVEFPEYYSIYREREFTHNGIRQGNRNPLLYSAIGADGLKTGSTSVAGFGLTASAVQSGRRLILVANGFETAAQRTRDTERLMLWGFRNFTNRTLFTASETVTDAQVWLGNEDTVPLVIQEQVTLTVPRRSWSSLEVKVAYDGPLPAPIVEGTEVAELVISAEGMETRRFPLVAAASVNRLGFLGRMQAAAGQLFWGGAQLN